MTATTSAPGEGRSAHRGLLSLEDMGESSRAGQLKSVIGIDGLVELNEAVRVVLDSRKRADATDHPIAVLIQPFIEPRFGGVLFGVDPVTGRPDRRVVTAVEGQPNPLVSGEVNAVGDADAAGIEEDA